MHLLTTKQPVRSLVAVARTAVVVGALPSRSRRGAGRRTVFGRRWMASVATMLLLASGSQTHLAAQPTAASGTRVTLVPSLQVVATSQVPAVARPGLTLDAAVRQTLSLHPNIKLQQQQVEIARGDLRAARGLFDELVAVSGTRSRQQTPTTGEEQAIGFPSSTVSNLTEYSTSLRKYFRSGLTVEPTLRYQRASQTPYPETANRADIALNAAYPLLRGRGRDVVTANERAGILGVQVSSQDLHQLQAERVLTTVAAYWSYVAAQKRLDILVQSEARTEQLVQETQALIEADKRPAADIKQAQANLAGRTASRLDAEATLFQAGRELGLSMGLPYEEIDRLPAPTDGFPVIPEEAVVPPEDVLLREALRRRTDLQAAQGRQNQSRILVNASTDALKHRLDLNVGLGFSGFTAGDRLWDYWTPFGNNVHGVNASMALAFEWPMKNDEAAGRLQHAAATLEQATIAASDLQRTILTDVSVARDDVARRASQVQNSRRAADLYRQAIEDERQKQQLGTSTILDLIVTEDRLTSSLLSELSATYAYAVAVARLRFESGVLLEGMERPEEDIASGTLTVVPQFAPGDEQRQ